MHERKSLSFYHKICQVLWGKILYVLHLRSLEISFWCGFVLAGKNLNLFSIWHIYIKVRHSNKCLGDITYVCTTTWISWPGEGFHIMQLYLQLRYGSKLGCKRGTLKTCSSESFIFVIWHIELFLQQNNFQGIYSFCHPSGIMKSTRSTEGKLAHCFLSYKMMRELSFIKSL